MSESCKIVNVGPVGPTPAKRIIKCRSVENALAVSVPCGAIALDPAYFVDSVTAFGRGKK